MPIEVCRPQTVISNGVWSLTPSSGMTLAEILADDSDLTYISSTVFAGSDATYAILDFDDVVLPDGAKIKGVAVKARVFESSPVAGGSFPLLSNLVRFIFEVVEEVVDDVVPGDLGDGLAALFRFLTHQPAPTPVGGASAAFQTLTFLTWPQKPSGGEWTLEAFNALTWKIGRTNAPTLVKFSEYYVELEYNERPEMTITAPTTPVTGTTRPVFGWTYADPEDDPQTHYRFKVFTEDDTLAVGFDPDTSVPVAQTVNSSGTFDWIAGVGTTWVCNKDLPNDTYVAYGQVRQQWTGAGEHKSDWATYVFEVDVPQPDAPAVTATANNVLNYVQLDLAPSGDNDPAIETYNVWYSDDFGVTWDVVRDGWQIQADADGLATLFDYEAPLREERWYVAKSYYTLSGTKVASDLSEVAKATPGARGWWFKDLSAPSLNLRVVVLEDERTIEKIQGVFPVLTADDGSTIAYKKIVNGPTSGQDGEQVLFFRGNDDESGWDQFQQLFRAGRDLLLQAPTGENIYVQLGKTIKVPWGARGNDVYYRTPGITFTEVPRPPDPSIPAGAPTAI